MKLINLTLDNIPNNNLDIIKSLTFNCDILYTHIIPHLPNCNHITFNNNTSQIPNVQALTFYMYVHNKQLYANVIHLKYNTYDNYIPTMDRVMELTLPYNYNVPFNMLNYPNLEKITFGLLYNQPYTISPKVKYVDFGGSFNQPNIDLWNVETIIMSKSYQHTLTIPSVLTSVTINGHHDLILHSNVHKLHAPYYIQSTARDVIMHKEITNNNYTTVTVPVTYNGTLNFASLLPHCTNLTVDTFNTLPSLTKLIYTGKVINVTLLPLSLQHLELPNITYYSRMYTLINLMSIRFGHYYDHNIDSNTVPTTINKICVHSKYRGNIMYDQFNNLTHITCPLNKYNHNINCEWTLL
jgi:hypothetical protein